ncbi:polyamine deacetylase HDAC10-like [Eriocheir sinensis]|uniref:polyamine deacetylase HDAC10-like n=1 Tax=Eriocheir sinensis TaxID=95602 RepID=UPI0021C88975|nr:polyamine deacetylase HDAC10-like [Eriocheir sinensis]
MQLLTPQTQQLRERTGNIQSASSGCGRCWGVPGCWGEASGCSLQAQREEVELPHSQERGLHVQGEEELQTLQENYKSVYLHPATYAFALLSAGSLLRVVDEVFAGRARAGVGIIRPPATTPSWTAPMASASTTTWSSPPTGWDAKVGAAWVLVVVWDVHHGSGIQHVFVAEPRVLYVSLHCHHHGLFFPSSEDPNYDEWGRDLAKATTLTLPGTR